MTKLGFRLRPVREIGLACAATLCLVEVRGGTRHGAAWAAHDQRRREG
jgi:hypothetical protein